MISFEQATALLRQAASPLPPRRVELDGAAGAVTAETLTAVLDVPGFDNAAMDGFALRAEDTGDATARSPAVLPVAGSIAAGSSTPVHRPGVAWEIMTGAPVPAGCDTIVPVERVAPLPPAATRTDVRFTEPVEPERNIRRTGTDFRRDRQIVAAGVRLGPQHLMALAATGHDEVLVRPAPRVALLTTGSELVRSGLPDHGRLRDANGPYLRAALTRFGAVGVGHASAVDSTGDLEEALTRLSSGCDVLVTTGGVSAGRLDLMPAAVAALGGEVLFHKVAIRPGKPVLAARLPQGPLLLALPGNPVAVAVGVRFFLAPLLRALQGLPPETPASASAHADIRQRGHLRFFAKAHAAAGADGRQVATILPGQESFRIAPLLDANCWAIIPEGDGVILAGEPVGIVPLYPLP